MGTVVVDGTIVVFVVALVVRGIVGTVVGLVRVEALVNFLSMAYGRRLRWSMTKVVEA